MNDVTKKKTQGKYERKKKQGKIHIDAGTLRLIRPAKKRFQ